jgi:hypothetical protein
LLQPAVALFGGPQPAAKVETPNSGLLIAVPRYAARNGNEWPLEGERGLSEGWLDDQLK